MLQQRPSKAGTSKTGKNRATKQSKPKDQEGVMPVGATVDPSAVGKGTNYNHPIGCQNP